jgi:dCTP deaminase
MSHNVLLFPELEKSLRDTRATGVFPSQKIAEFIEAGRIRASSPITDIQIQPASLDLRLGPVAYRVRASFLPGKSSTVDEKVREFGMTEIDLVPGAVFEKYCTYIVPLMEELFLPEDISGKANPKSTTGRLDLFTRLITDFGTGFEQVGEGYRGKLYVEVMPRTFSVRLQTGMRLNQLRFVRGNPLPLREEYTLGKLHGQEPLAYAGNDQPADSAFHGGLPISLDLSGTSQSPIVGYKAKSHGPLIDLSKVNYYDPDEFWEPIRSSRRIILDPGDFYILISKEKVSIPPHLAGVMMAIDPSMGEFRIHYAGFFDPGFGYGLEQGKGTRAVLEVRSHDVPFVIEDGQTVGRLEYVRLMEPPDKIYGVNIGSSYQAQELSLSKQFKRSG